MARFLKSKKELIGISPDDLKFSWEKKIDKTRLRLISYDKSNFVETELQNIGESENNIKKGTTTWINIDGLHDIDTLQEVSSLFGIETYIMSNVLETHGRPRIHIYEGCIFVSAKMLQYNEQNGNVISENLSIIFKENLLISFQERVGDVFNPVRERLRKNRKRIRSSGSDYLAVSLLDIVIDNYIHIVSLIGDEIEELDNELIKNPSSESLKKINRYKAEINYLRKTVKPCREMILNLIKSDNELIEDKNNVHLNALQNNIALANESVDNYRDILSDQLNIFHSTVTYKLNYILKFLTIFSVIFIPLTFIAGVYGTNFDNIPELHYKYGYFIMLGVMTTIVVAMIIYFKQKKWF